MGISNFFLPLVSLEVLFLAYIRIIISLIHWVKENWIIISTASFITRNDPHIMSLNKTNRLGCLTTSDVHQEDEHHFAKDQLQRSSPTEVSLLLRQGPELLFCSSMRRDELHCQPWWWTRTFGMLPFDPGNRWAFQNSTKALIAAKATCLAIHKTQSVCT